MTLLVSLVAPLLVLGFIVGVLVEEIEAEAPREAKPASKSAWPPAKPDGLDVSDAAWRAAVAEVDRLSPPPRRPATRDVVLELRERGRSYQQIADELGVAPHDARRLHLDAVAAAANPRYRP